jgi:hypothetical protein
MFGNIKGLIPHFNHVNPDASPPPIGHLGWDGSAVIQLQIVRVRLGGEIATPSPVIGM